MGLRIVGRWLYHAITSSEKRPYIQLDLSELEALVAKATEDRDILKLFAILDELKYRISSPGKRHQLAKQVVAVLGEYEGILVSPSANHVAIAAARKKYEVDREFRYQEQQRLNREEKERQRKELAAEQLRRDQEKKEAERKAREAAAEQERQEAQRKAREAAAEQERQEAEAKAQREEAERKAKEAAAEQERQEAEAKAQREEAERKDREAAAEKERLEAEAEPNPDQDLATDVELEERAAADASRDAALETRYLTRPTNFISREISHEELREERRELARLRRLEREGRSEDRPIGEASIAVDEYKFEQAEQFAPSLRSIPANWSEWSEQHWNIKLLQYCFVEKAAESANQGIPSTEEDLVFVTGDREASPSELAQTLVDRVREFSYNLGLSPARLLIKRLENWDYKSASPPEFFAFLWTTCLIAQGFPSPFQKGEFHKRYERDDVFGANESQYLSKNLPAAWTQLSSWLERCDIFDGIGHRRLVLPRTDPSRCIISHSWKLSFPCRADRKKLHDILGKSQDDWGSDEGVDIQLISRIYHQGEFTPEFSSALKQQIDLVQTGSQSEEWLSAIIQREIEALGTSRAQAGRECVPRVLIRSIPKIMLHLDDEDCYLELVLPSQSVQVEKKRRTSPKTYCAISLESSEKQARVIGELDIDPRQDEIVIPELRSKISEEREEYLLRLRHQGLDNAVLAEWNCAGIPEGKPYFLIDAESNEVIDEIKESSHELSLAYEYDWGVVTSDGIEAEEPIRVSKLGKWRILLLTRVHILESPEIISLINEAGERIDINWGGIGAARLSDKPLLQGLPLLGQANAFTSLPTNPEVWLPPLITEAMVEVFKIEKGEFYVPLKTMQISASRNWQPSGARSLMTCPGRYSIKILYTDMVSSKSRRWLKNIQIFEEPEVKALQPDLLHAEYRLGERLKVLELEKGVEPLGFRESHDFWNSIWQVIGLWPYERIKVELTGNAEEYSLLLSADGTGMCEFHTASFEPFLLSHQAARLSIHRQGFSFRYELAALDGSPSRIERQITQSIVPPNAEPDKRPVKRRKSVDLLEIVVYGMRSEAVQDMLIDEIEDLIDDSFGYLDRQTENYPHTRRAPGRRFVFHRISFDTLDKEEMSNLRVGIGSLVASAMRTSGLDFRDEWSRRRQ